MIRLVQYTLPEIYDSREGDYLKHDERTSQLAESKITRCYASTCITTTPSSKYMENGKYWHQYFLFEDFVLLAKDRGINLLEAIDYALHDGDVHLACDCVHPDAEIVTNRGVLPIKDVKVGDKVLTHKGRFREVIRTIESDESKQFYSIKVSGQLKPLICSGEHPILTFSNVNENPTWIKVKDLKGSGSYYERNKVLLPIISGGKEFNPDLARLLGYYLAEGSLQDYQTTEGEKLSSTVRLSLNVNEYDTLVKDIQEICNSLGYGFSCSRVEYPNKKWLALSIKSLEFAELCNSLCGRYSDKKQLSSEVFEWNEAARVQLLVGFFLGDGWKEKSKGMTLMTTSKMLAQQLQVLIASLGLNSFLSYRNKNIKPHCDGVNRKPLYQVRCSENSCSLLYSACYTHLRDKDKSSIGTRGRSKSYVANGYFYRYIQEIKPIEYSGVHYDLTVEEDESFIANSVIIHNCPAYKYWAYEYMGTKLGYTYGPYKTNLAPTRNNINLRGTVCKHLDKAIQMLWSNTDKLAKYFADYYKVNYATKNSPNLTAINYKKDPEVLSVTDYNEAVPTTYYYTQSEADFVEEQKEKANKTDESSDDETLETPESDDSIL